jgi:peptidoglycan lytic transglycosylase
MGWTLPSFIAALAVIGGIASDAALAKNGSTISGVAAFYSSNYRGRTASGQVYDPTKLTCAHRTLPFGTHLLVRDPKSGRSVLVTVNDRGPFNKGRVIDLSLAAAKVLRMTGRGLMRITAAVQ